MNRQERRAAERQAKRQAKNINLSVASYFYSPTDSVDDVLAITFSSIPLSIRSSFPLESYNVIAAPKFKAQLDADFGHCPEEALKQVQDVQRLITSMRLLNPMTVVDETLKVRLVITAGIIGWLTERGIIKQSEYNGTQFIRM